MMLLLLLVLVEAKTGVTIHLGTVFIRSMPTIRCAYALIE
jgi:hypothetical protein